MAIQQKLVPDASPFMKWAGGKSQLLGEFYKRFPPGLKTGDITQLCGTVHWRGGSILLCEREIFI